MAKIKSVAIAADFFVLSGDENPPGSNTKVCEAERLGRINAKHLPVGREQRGFYVVKPSERVQSRSEQKTLSDRIAFFLF